jgi:hypothetical protein
MKEREKGKKEKREKGKNVRGKENEREVKGEERKK